MASSRNPLTLVADIVLALAFAGCVVFVVLLGAGATFNYPAYSSLNNASEGTKAYFDALQKLGFNVERNYRPLRKLSGKQADIFYAGITFASLEQAEESEFDEFEQIAKSGCRLIIAVQPDALEFEKAAVAPKQPKSKQKATKIENKDLLRQRWGLEIAWRDAGLGREENSALTKLGVKGKIGYVAKWDPSWSPLLWRQGNPIFLERRFGKGSVLFVSDARYFTNRDLLSKPDTQILTALVGSPKHMIFDESHLGLEDTGTVIGLTTAHHLNWILAGFVVLAALYIWRSSVSFIPRRRRRKTNPWLVRMLTLPFGICSCEACPQKVCCIELRKNGTRAQSCGRAAVSSDPPK